MFGCRQSAVVPFPIIHYIGFKKSNKKSIKVENIKYQILTFFKRQKLKLSPTLENLNNLNNKTFY